MRALGARPRAHRRFPDHHAWVDGDLAGLSERGARLVTTTKDAVKLAGLQVARRLDVWVLEVEFALTSGAPALAALFDALVAPRVASQGGPAR